MGLVCFIKQVKVTQSCPALCDPEILQAKILEWVAIPFAGDLPNPGIKLRSLVLWADSLPAEPQVKPKNTGVGTYPFSSGSSQPRN